METNNRILDLETKNKALSDLVQRLNKRKMERTDANSIMWRNKYYTAIKEIGKLKRIIEGLRNATSCGSGVLPP